MITSDSTLAATRIFVIEGQLLFGKALCQLLSVDPTVQIVGDSEDVHSAALAKAKPNLILLDVDGGAVELGEALETCREAAPQAKICVLSMRQQPEMMQCCLAAGADGYVIKDVTPSELLRAVKMVAGGDTYVDPRVAGGLLRRRSMTNGRPDINELSSRETEVVRLIAGGLSNKEIGSRLVLSEKTVKNHVSRVFVKLNICARTQAAVHAIKMGLV